MLWFLLWLVLVLAAVAVMAVLVRRVYRASKALLAEMSVATDRLGQVSAALEDRATPLPGGPVRR